LIIVYFTHARFGLQEARCHPAMALVRIPLCQPLHLRGISTKFWTMPKRTNGWYVAMDMHSLPPLLTLTRKRLPMPDVFTPDKRSDVMSRIRGRGNRDTELLLAKLFRQYRITGWRRHLKVKLGELRNIGRESTTRKQRNKPKTRAQLAVHPDFFFLHQRTAVFVDGCFWHGCPKHSNLPANNCPFWEKKLNGNKVRDRFVNRCLRKAGWRVVRIWEHDVAKRPNSCIRRIQRALEPDDA
jgi:DNA mismatch endonuclease, patch repair protein